jgi:predicted HNH restriction endonuclease
MAFKDGNQGYSHWDDCKKREVAAITYIPLAHTDLSKYPKDEPRELWSRLKSAQKGSLRKVAYDMKLGDTIYVKEGKRIVGKGTIVSEYFFDDVNCIFSQNKDRIPWSHQVKVQWRANFPPVEVPTHAEQHTVLKLSEKAVEQIEKEVEQIENQTSLDIPELTAPDGNPVLAEHLRYERNSTFIHKIKERALARNKMLNCQVCGFSFLEKYGEIGKGFIEAHHKKPLSEIKQQTSKTEDDFILVCSNCHRMLHQNSLAIDVKELKLLIKKD